MGNSPNHICTGTSFGRSSDDGSAQAFFPLFMDLTDKRVLFVGGGAIASRRVGVLLGFAGEIAVCAPAFSPGLERLAEDGAIALVRQDYSEDVLDGADIVLACTDDPAVNDAVWEHCKRRGVLVNVCSDRLKCDFHFPGVAKRGNVVVGVNAGGRDHRLVKRLRMRIEQLLEGDDSGLAV